MNRVLLGGLAAAGAVLSLRAIFGPGHYPVAVNSPMNVEGIVALLFLALLLARSGERHLASSPWKGSLMASALLACAVLAAFAGYLDFPFLADDYSHIWNARQADARALLAHFTVPEPDRFFRPVGYLSYAFDARWAGVSPAAWRLGNCVLHVVNTLLVFLLCRELRFSRAGAFAGALLFGVHASVPEAVTWVAARFDLLAVLFALACLLCILRGFPVWIAALFLALAISSKESAYVTPFLAALLLWYRGERWRTIARRAAPLLAVEVVALAYRLYLLKGIGGYHDPTNGSPTIFNFKLTSTLKALLPRFWAAMFFPVNWTGELNLAVALPFALAVAALCYLAWRGADRRGVLLGVAFASICTLPVHQFLSIGPDLEKSRVLYFASAGLALVFAALLHGPGKMALAAFACVTLFQISALEHNLAIWKRVGLLAGRTCLAAANSSPLAVENLPNVVDGVYFLHTGFPECTYLLNRNYQTGVFAARRPGIPFYTWDPGSRTVRREPNLN